MAHLRDSVTDGTNSVSALEPGLDPAEKYLNSVDTLAHKVASESTKSLASKACGACIPCILYFKMNILFFFLPVLHFSFFFIFRCPAYGVLCVRIFRGPFYPILNRIDHALCDLRGVLLNIFIRFYISAHPLPRIKNVYVFKDWCTIHLTLFLLYIFILLQYYVCSTRVQSDPQGIPLYESNFNN